MVCGDLLQFAFYLLLRQRDAAKGSRVESVAQQRAIS
jgi:hypothetical protein